MKTPKPFLELAGVTIPEQMQGKSVVPLLQGKNEGWRKSFLFTYWPDLIFTLPRITAIRTEKYLYSKTPDISDIDELYDEQNDPAELKNLAENPEYANLKKQLSDELEALKQATGYHDEVPRPDPEPVLTVKTGIVFSVDFKELSFDKRSDKTIILNGVKRMVVNGKGCGSFSDGAYASVPNHPDIDPSLGTFVIDCIIKPESPDGVIVSTGSWKDGWALFVEKGIPGFVVSHDRHLQFVDGTAEITGKWSHLVAIIENYKNIISLYADGILLGRRQMLLPIKSIRNDAGDIILGQDPGEQIDPEEISKYKYNGWIHSLKLYREKMSDSKIKELSQSR